MSTGLPISDVSNVQIIMSPLAAAVRNFGAMMIIGSSDVIDTSERLRYYAGITDIATDFGTESEEYKAAIPFFGQSPAPLFCYIARWAKTATSGAMRGAILTSTQQAIANFTAVSSGAMFIKIDGIPISLNSINLSSVTNLNGVASEVETALDAKATGSTVVWDAGYKRFVVKSGTTGADSKVFYASAPTATGSISFAGQPSNNDTITLNGTAVTFVSGTPTSGQVQIGASLSVTLTSLLTLLNASTDAELVKFVYIKSGTVLYLQAAASGTGGNSLTVAKSGTNISVSGSTLSGGSGTDISSLMGLRTGQAVVPVDGVAAEDLIDCVTDLADLSNDWYGVYVADNTLVDADIVAVADFIEAATPSRIFGNTIITTDVIDSASVDNLAITLKAAAYSRTLDQYSSTNNHAAMSILGRIATVDFTAQNSTLTVKFKQEPTVVAENLRSSQARTLKERNVNVFVKYQNNTNIIQEGVMCSGMFIDERHGLDWLQNDMQTEEYNLLYASGQPKIPQTDAGFNQFVLADERSLERAVNNGLIAAGVWNGPSFGALKTGDTLTKGYYVYCPPADSQAQGDRDQRIAPTRQIAIKLAGAVHKSNVIINVNR